VRVDVTSRRESERLAEHLRQIEWDLVGIRQDLKALYTGMLPGELHALDVDLERLIEDAHELRRVVARVWDQVTARTDLAA
jgi:hypothetical protein